MNKIILSGNICRDIEVYKYNNKSCIKNSIAVKRDYKNSEGKYDTDFFNITLWETRADFLSKFAQKGDKVLIIGRLMNNEFELEDGTKKTTNEVQVDGIEIISSKKDKEGVTPEEIFGDKLEVKDSEGDDLLD